MTKMLVYVKFEIEYENLLITNHKGLFYMFFVFFRKTFHCTIVLVFLFEIILESSSFKIVGTIDSNAKSPS
jgi:hypothetical protein